MPSKVVAGKGEIAAEYVEIESDQRSNRPQLARALAETLPSQGSLIRRIDHNGP